MTSVTAGCELGRSLGHAATLHDGEKYLQVAQFEMATKPGIPIDLF
jgi:hypothetical protein